MLLLMYFVDLDKFIKVHESQL